MANQGAYGVFGSMEGNRNTHGLVMKLARSARPADASLAAAVLGRELEPNETNELLKACLKMGSFMRAMQAAHLAQHKLTGPELDQLLHAALRLGKVKDAVRAADQAGRRLTNQQINCLVDSCLRKGWLREAIRAASLLRDSAYTKSGKRQNSLQVQ
jgi:hypothetical protein